MLTLSGKHIEVIQHVSLAYYTEKGKLSQVRLLFIAKTCPCNIQRFFEL